MPRRNCKICKVSKPLNTEYFYRKTPTTFDTRCKECHKNESRTMKREKYDPVKQRAKDIKRRQSGKAGENYQTMTNKYPEKYKARYTLRNYVRLGKIKKGLCEVCKDSKTQAHHDDYSKPLDVKWLCSKHHKEIHHLPSILSATEPKLEYTDTGSLDTEFIRDLPKS